MSDNKFKNYEEDDDGLGTTIEIAAAFKRIHDHYLKCNAAQHEMELSETRRRLYSRPVGQTSASLPKV